MSSRANKQAYKQPSVIEHVGRRTIKRQPMRPVREEKGPRTTERDRVLEEAMRRSGG